MRFSLVADHWQYFAIIGPIALAAAGITLAMDRFGKSKIIFCGALLSLLGFLTWRQSQTFENPETLWRTILARNPDCPVAHNNLGTILIGKGKLDDAMEHFQMSVEFKPDDADSHNNLGFVLFKRDQTDKAIDQYQKALAIKPDDADANHNLGIALYKIGRVDDALVYYRKAWLVQPDNAEINNDLANALSRKGETAAAIQHWQRALEIRPQYVPTENNLAWALATNPDPTLRNGAKAIQLAQAANQSSGGKSLLLLRTLAAAYAEGGQFTNALATAGQALQLAATEGNMPMINSFEAQMKLYESGKPLRTPAK
jgi:Tfp pilus assembly protein PilF